MPRRKPKYTTELEQWKRELCAELGRDITYGDISEGTGLNYSTLMKHVSHEFVRPDYGAASRICAYFNRYSARTRTPLQYFVEIGEKEAEAGQPVGATAG